jgi:hypothetical protein
VFAQNTALPVQVFAKLISSFDAHNIPTSSWYAISSFQTPPLYFLPSNFLHRDIFLDTSFRPCHPNFDGLSTLRFLSGFLHQAGLLGAPPVSVWNLCRCWIGQTPCVSFSPFHPPTTAPTLSLVIATIPTTTSEAPFHGQKDIDQGIGYISVVVVSFMVGSLYFPRGVTHNFRHSNVDFILGYSVPSGW